MGIGLAIGSLIAGSGIVILLEGARKIEVVEPPVEEVPIEIPVVTEVQVVIPDPGEILITQIGL